LPEVLEVMRVCWMLFRVGSLSKLAAAGMRKAVDGRKYPIET